MEVSGSLKFGQRIGVGYDRLANGVDAARTPLAPRSI
jgi:hypothetical protein